MPVPQDPQKHHYLFTDDIKFLQKAVVLHPEQPTHFLTLRRSPDSYSRPNDWDLPGGNVLYGELHNQSLITEITEETQLEVKDVRPLQVVTMYQTEPSLYHIFIGYVCQAAHQSVQLSHEHTEYRWVSVDEFRQLRPPQFLLDLVTKHDFLTDEIKK